MQTRQKKEPPPRGRGEGFELTAAGQGMDMPRCGSTQSRYTQHTKKSGPRHLEREGENEKTPPQGATGQGLDAFSGPLVEGYYSRQEQGPPRPLTMK